MTSNNPQEAFYNILSKCLDTNNEIRKSAEAQISMISQTNYDDILLNCSVFLRNDQLPIEIRQLCATIIKNSVNITENEKKWMEITKEKRATIQENVLACLGSEKKEIRRGAATAVAAIAKIDIPIGEWANLIPTLHAASKHENINFKISSIITLGYICQEVSPDNFSLDDREKIFQSIFLNFPYENSNNEELIYQTLSALSKYVGFLGSKMENEPFRKELYNHLFRYASNYSHENINIIALQIINDITKVYYDYVKNEMEVITKFISEIMKKDNEKIGTQGYMFWIYLSEEEIARSLSRKPINNYCQLYITMIWNDIQYTLVRKDAKYDRDNEDEFTRYTASSYLMDNLSKLVDETFINGIFTFINQCLQTKETSKETIAFYAFSSILETKLVDKIRAVIPSCITQLIDLLQTNDVQLQLVIAWCIEKIAEFHSFVFYQRSDLFNLVITTIINKLTSFTQKVTVHLCYAIHHLANNLKNIDNKGSSPFSDYLEVLLNLLLSLAYSKNAYNANYNVSMSAFLAIGTLIEHCDDKDKNTITKFFATLFDAMSKSLLKQNFPDEAMQYDFQSYLANIIIAYSSCGKFGMNQEQGESVYKLFKASFDQRKSVYEEGVIACASLASLVKEGYDNILKDFINYLSFGLKNWQETVICSKTIFSISDIIRAIEQRFVPYLGQIMPLLMEIVSSNTDKQLKVQVILVFTDMFLCLPNEVWPYYEGIMTFIAQAIDAALIKPDINDPDLCEYYELLRERLIECLSCVTRDIQSYGKGDIFKKYLEKSMRFISIINSDEYQPSLYIIHECAGIISDLCDLYNRDMASFIDDDSIKYMTKELKKTGVSDSIIVAEHLQQKALMLRITAVNL